MRLAETPQDLEGRVQQEIHGCAGRSDLHDVCSTCEIKAWCIYILIALAASEEEMGPGLEFSKELEGWG